MVKLTFFYFIKLNFVQVSLDKGFNINNKQEDTFTVISRVLFTKYLTILQSTDIKLSLIQKNTEHFSLFLKNSKGILSLYQYSIHNKLQLSKQPFPQSNISSCHFNSKFFKRAVYLNPYISHNADPTPLQPTENIFFKLMTY